MEKLIAVGFLFSIVLIAVASIKKVELAKKGGLFFLTILSLLFFTNFGINDGEAHQDLFLVSALILSVTYFLSFLRKIPALLRWVLPILLVGLFAIGVEPLKFGEYVINFSDSKLWIFITIGYVLAPLSELKSKALHQFFGVSELHLQRAVSPLFFGLAVFASSFFFANAGIFIVALGIAMWVFANNGRNNFILPALGLVVAQSFLQLGNLESLETLLGKNLEGLFFGVSAVLLCNVLASSEKRTILGQFTGFAVGVILAKILLFLGTQKADFGGVDAYVAFLIGISLTFFAIRETAWNSVLFGGVVSTGLILIPMLYPPVPAELLITSGKSSQVIAETIVADPFESAQNNSLDSVLGNYVINSKTFKFDFELGPKGGRTKGKFKELIGTVKLDGEKSTFEVLLPSKSLTTMNMYRDESLHGKEYFDVAKFASMKFSSKKLLETNGTYELQGHFVMLGVKKAQNVSLKYTGLNDAGNPVLIGKGQIDRTQFGMTPDPKEGNLVDFSFEIELLKK